MCASRLFRKAKMIVVQVQILSAGGNNNLKGFISCHYEKLMKY